MIQNVLRDIGGIGAFDAISICLFLLVFCGAVTRAVCLKKSFLQRMSAMPLDDERDVERRSDHE